MRIAIVMITINREEAGKRNYLSNTIWNLQKSGLVSSDTPYSFHIFDGGSKSLDHLLIRNGSPISDILTSADKLAPNVNAGRALIFGSQLEADWVLFLEDDLEFCNKFLDNVAWWLGHFAGTEYRLFTMYTPYREILETYNISHSMATWNYPVDKFYGTQAFVVRPREAQIIGEYLVNLSYSTSSYDIEIQNWMKANPIQKEPENFLASVPCFVQHIGEQSVLFNDPKRFHQTTGFIGIDWSAI